MDRAQKQEAIETLKGVFADAGAVVVTHYMGLTVAELTDLRGRLRKEGAKLQVVKNTLAQKALDGSVGEAGDALFTTKDAKEHQDAAPWRTWRLGGRHGRLRRVAGRLRPLA